MPKILDDRMVDEVEVEMVSYKPNVQRHKEDGNGDPMYDEDGQPIYEYTVQLRIAYFLLDSNGKRLDRKVTTHYVYPLDNQITSAQFINNIDTLAPDIKSAAIADRNSFTITT